MELKIILWIAVCFCVAVATADYDQFLINHDDTVKGQLIYWHGCASDANQCNLTCVFNDYENNETIFVDWTNNSNPVTQDDTSERITKPGAQQSFVISYLTIDPKIQSNYTCISYSIDTADVINNHTFPITLLQKPPIIGEKGEKNMTYVISGTGQCTINLTCHVTAHPIPTVNLISYNSTSFQPKYIKYMTFSSGNIRDSYTFQTSIQTSNGENSDIKYFCVASNSMGISASYPIYPYIVPGAPVMNQNKIPLEATNSTYDLVCNSSGGFPAPKINWSILINDIPMENISNTVANYYPIDHGTSYITISIDAETAKSNITVRCSVCSKDENYTTEAKFIPSTEISIVSVKNCSAANFYKESYCTLECKVYSPYSVTAQWLYMSTDNQPISNSYQLSPTIYLSNNSNYYTASITLDDYFNGYYKCQINSIGISLHNVFHISEKKGSQLGGFCLTTKDCLAINSICNNFVCNCLGEYPVPMTISPNPPACLSKSGPNMNCTTDNQCNSGKDIPHAYQCRGNECICLGVPAYVSETGTTECVTPVSYYGTCVYDAQCQLIDENMYCTTPSPGSNGYCNCQSGYQYYYAYNECYSIYGQYLSVSAALGIAFGVVLLICIIFVFIIILSKSHSRRNANRVRTTTNMRTNCPPEFVNINPIDISYPMESPPSYGEIRRSETPPPAFEDSFDLKFDSSTASVLYLVNNNYSEDEKVEGATNNAMEHEA